MEDSGDETGELCADAVLSLCCGLYPGAMPKVPEKDCVGAEWLVSISSGVTCVNVRGGDSLSGMAGFTNPMAH